MFFSSQTLVYVTFNKLCGFASQLYNKIILNTVYMFCDHL